MEEGISNIEIEIDSQTAMELIRDGSERNSPYRALIEDANFLLRRCQCSIQDSKPYPGRQTREQMLWLT
ncbi:hypothetical protein ACSBR1_007864 [Camellia fascicularis]